MRRDSSDVGEKIVFLDDEVEPQILLIIRNATKYVRFVTPYLGLWGHLQNAIDEAVSRGVDISFIIRAKENPPIGDMEWLVDHKVGLYELPDLHAKIYISERVQF
jgi:phosphatidylserine/phosphatidylglycerophosphate/cardiolipin synthase-like enzyme